MCVTSNEYVVMVTTFFQCMSLIKLNAKENEWHSAMETLQEGNRKAKKVAKKGEKKKNDLIYEQQYTNACKLGENWNSNT